MSDAKEMVPWNHSEVFLRVFVLKRSVDVAHRNSFFAVVCFSLMRPAQRPYGSTAEKPIQDLHYLVEDRMLSTTPRAISRGP